VIAIVERNATPLESCPMYICPRPGMIRDKIEPRIGDFLRFNLTPYVTVIRSASWP